MSSHLLTCLFFLSSCFAFPLLKLQVFSQSFALTGEDQLESSLLATMWDWRGEVATGSAAAELFYTYAITHPGWGRVHNVPLPSSCKHVADLTPKEKNKRACHLFTICVDSSIISQHDMMNGTNTVTSVKLPLVFPSKCVITRRQLSRILFPDERSGRNSRALLTSAADT